MELLPIYEALPELKQKLREHNTVILQAPPGAGKSTVLPLELLAETWLKGQKIVMLEPRRLAARSVAMRMAQQREEQVGETVGYRVRFDSKIGAHTKIEVVTEGILTRRVQEDNSLEGIGLVIFDEFHERSLQADLALALCRESQQVLREDLRILIMSATLDGDRLSKLLNKAPIVTSLGRQFPIQTVYLGADNKEPIWQNMAIAIKKAAKEQTGDILAFLPGVGEIQRTSELILSFLDAAWRVCPLYGELSPSEQQAAISPDPYGKRKVVLATSIAETSLTIEGIKTVIDSGLSRVPKYNARSGLTKLETVPVTQDAADQRAGRAGRLGPGVCYRLWTEATHQHLITHRQAEILEADLSGTVLELANWGIQDPAALTWLTPPPPSAVTHAQEMLVSLEALEDKKITAKGKEMLRLPTHPRLAHMFQEAQKLGLIGLATDVAAVLEERDPLPRDQDANFAYRVELLRKWRAKEYVKAERTVLERIERLAASWRSLFKTVQDNEFPNYAKVGLLLSFAYPERVAKQKEGDVRYQLANGRTVRLPQNDALEQETWLAIAQLDAGSGQEGKIFSAAPIQVQDLKDRLKERRVVTWDSNKGQLIARMEKCFGDIAVASTPLQEIPDEERIAILCKAIKQEGARLLPWTEELTAWQNRVLSLRHWRPEEDWPDVSTAHLIDTVEAWLGPFLTSVRKKEDLQKLELEPLAQSVLSWENTEQLAKLAPNKLLVPSGFEVSLQYFPDGRDPVLAVRLQEMFGLLDTPTVNGGRTKVLLHLLSPGYKPVQVTQDLRSFWQNTYPEVRKELRIRYQKHFWPEDPWTAEAVRGVKRKQ